MAKKKRKGKPLPVFAGYTPLGAGFPVSVGLAEASEVEMGTAADEAPRATQHHCFSVALSWEDKQIVQIF